MILKCISQSCWYLRDEDDDHDHDHDNVIVPEPEPAANNGDGVSHKSQGIVNREKSKCISSYGWHRIIVKWKRESRLNKDRGNSLEKSLSKDKSQLDELPGRYMKEASFNLGVGIGLAYHTAEFRDELNKMAELRGQMQHILQNVGDALATKKMDQISPMKKASDYHLEDVCESSNQQGAESRTTCFVCDDNTSSNYHDCDQTTTTQERFSEGMDQLEEELESEFEQLRLHLDMELMLKHEEERKLQMNVLESGGGLRLSERYRKVVVDPPQAAEEEHNGVCPTELERRLHELLESRQEERIKELEAALERAKRKLSEKEREVSWWKNTASIVSKHVPDPSFLNR